MVPVVPVTTETAQGAGWRGEQVGTLALPCHAGWADSAWQTLRKPQKATFCFLDGSQRPRESLGILLPWGVDGLCPGVNGTTQRLPPLFLLPGSLVPSSAKLPCSVLRVWLSASQLLP